MRVLIAPVGEQPTPNLIPLFAEPPERRAECVQFLVSDKLKIRDVAGHLRSAIERDPKLAGMQVAGNRPMAAWELDTARDDCEAIIRHYRDKGDEVMVNLTGGTKMMSLAAYQAAVNVGAPMLYVNTEQKLLMDFDTQGRPVPPRNFTAPISIETQLRAAGREFNAKKPPLPPKDLREDWARFAAQIVGNYNRIHVNLIRPILKAAGKSGQAISFKPNKNDEAVAQQAHALGLWDWNQTQGTFAIKDSDAFAWLNGGWVEMFALKTLSESGYFDDVLGAVEIEAVEGELDVVVARNGQLGIVECKTEGPQDEKLTDAIAKLRLHEVMFGGAYAKAVFARPSNENYRQWESISKQYALPEPIYGAKLQDLARRVKNLLDE